ncbi:MAG: sigma-70 family RNA polymerase sigma factor [Gammaproteobacteria bacterium]
MTGAVLSLTPFTAFNPALTPGALPDPALMTSQQSILQRIANGDAAAVQQCIDAYGNLIWSLARRFLRNSADAEDVVQEIFIDLWNSAGRFDATLASETTFVSTIARRRLIDRLRKNTRTPGMDSLDDEESGALDQPFVDPPMEQEADAAVVERILTDMEPEHRQILSLSLYEGYSHREIAEQMNLPLGTVKTRIRRGLISIRDQLNITVDPAMERQ